MRRVPLPRGIPWSPLAFVCFATVEAEPAWVDELESVRKGSSVHWAPCGIDGEQALSASVHRTALAKRRAWRSVDGEAVLVFRTVPV